MPDVVGIRFKSCGKIYDFEVNGIDAKEGDSVVVESDFGLSIGRVIAGRHFVESPERELKKVIRTVTEEDIKAVEENKKLEKEARDFCLERVMARGLQMKLVGAEATLDRKRIIFYFTADGRIDFRELVKDLAARFKTRIEMRQIGVRDEAKLIGGLGVCGRELCCNTFLASFAPVSIKMAKKQELVLNVGKLSGLCGRLMCCLRYEYDGDMESISSDDEISIEAEEVPVEKAGSGISAVLSKLEQSIATEESIETPPQPKPEQPKPEQLKSEQTEHRHKKFRYKRRRFRR
jgi:cell fate regulator YaaT (PSP1 superfamily)